MDVVQIHRADEIAASIGKALFVDTSTSNRGKLSIDEIFETSSRGSRERTSVFNVVFLKRYGYFARYATLKRSNGLVTHVQAYHPAGKTTIPRGTNFLAMCAMCGQVESDELVSSARDGELVTRRV